MDQVIIKFQLTENTNLITEKKTLSKKHNGL